MSLRVFSCRAKKHWGIKKHRLSTCEREWEKEMRSELSSNAKSDVSSNDVYDWRFLSSKKYSSLVPNTAFNIYDRNKHHIYWFISFSSCLFFFLLLFLTLCAFVSSFCFCETKCFFLELCRCGEKSILLATHSMKYAPGLHRMFLLLLSCKFSAVDMILAMYQRIC